MRRIAGAGMSLALCALLLSPVVARAAAPANDSFAGAVVIDPSALPFATDLDISEATAEPGEPASCSASPSTVWYAFTPATAGVLTANLSGASFYDTSLAVFVALGPGLGGLAYAGGGTYSACYGSSPIIVPVSAGSTYYLQVGSVYSGGGTVHLNVQTVPPPVNDAFANATPITALPFTDSADTTASTIEAGEPSTSCAGPANSVWYQLELPTTTSVTAVLSEYWSTFAVFAGTTIADLTELGCRNFGGSVTFLATAGQTYYLQVVPLNPINAGVLHLLVEQTPPPTASFSFGPGDPTLFDSVSFWSYSYDPLYVGIASLAWDFGDGATSTEPTPTHRFAKDGDYTVSLEVTTFDGRTGQASQTLAVRTHDVAIAKFTVPTVASANQTRQVTVGITDLRYPDTVTVQLLKSSPAGWVTVGTLTQSVPVRAANRTTNFVFSYTFTKDDAALGRVTFRSDATIAGYRDALPADNSIVALATKVTR